MKLSNKTYDILKWIAQILLPALGTFYFALSKIWGLPYGEEIVGTIAAVDAFLGALLGLSSKAYYEEQETTEALLKSRLDEEFGHDTADD